MTQCWIFYTPLGASDIDALFFFKKMGHPWPLIRLFSVFFKQTSIQFYYKLMWKMSIQYTALGFKPTTLKRESPPITTRPGHCSSMKFDKKIKKFAWINPMKEKCSKNLCYPVKLVTKYISIIFIASLPFYPAGQLLCNISPVKCWIFSHLIALNHP